MKILVADDDEIVLLLAKKMGEAVGHEVDVASSVLEADRLATGTRYDSAAIGLNLPTPDDGLRLIQKLLGDCVPKVVLLAEQDIELEDPLLLRTLSVEILMKPFTVPELLRALGVRTPKA